jgi:PTH1 family peptidyl-tRNA hydrolase
VDDLEFMVVGLGNPGEQYENTPHNLGFLVIDELARRHGIRITRRENTSLVGLGTASGKRVALAKPQTFMNLSGPAVKGLIERYGIGADRLIVIYDELDLPWQTLRIRPRGSSAGHKGMQNVLRSLGTNEIARVRLGIDPGHPRGDGAEFVLSPFRRGQKKEVEEMVTRGADAVESILAEGVEKSMAIYNRRARGSTEEEG